MGPQVLPEPTRRLTESGDGAFRGALVGLARNIRSADALPLLDRALQDESPVVWKEALDGLVTLASPASVRLLEEALDRTPPGDVSVEEWTSWVREALQQARADYEARGGVA